MFFSSNHVKFLPLYKNDKNFNSQKALKLNKNFKYHRKLSKNKQTS